MVVVVVGDDEGLFDVAAGPMRVSHVCVRVKLHVWLLLLLPLRFVTASSPHRRLPLLLVDVQGVGVAPAASLALLAWAAACMCRLLTVAVSRC